MKNIDLEESKQLELAILLDVAAFCEEHGLRYYLAYGTLIGALRHKGFIPWDDDIDLQMPREDYNKLIDLYNTQKKTDHYYLVAPTDPLSRHSFVKVTDTRTVKIEANTAYPNGYLGVDIDIFALDGQPSEEPVYEAWKKALLREYWLMYYGTLTASGSLKRRIGLALYHLKLKLQGGNARVYEKSLALHARYPYENAAWVGGTESVFVLRGDRIPSKDYAGTCEVEFEGHMFPAPVGYHDILTRLYGDYMTPPPKEKQVTHHANAVYWKESK